MAGWSHLFPKDISLMGYTITRPFSMIAMPIDFHIHRVNRLSRPLTRIKLLLKLGQTVITHGALEAITKAEQTPLEFLIPHIHRNWGEVCQADKYLNDWALANGERVLSAYRTNADVRIWVITEADRSSTCILLPEEY